jgi:rare lipoprotein A
MMLRGVFYPVLCCLALSACGTQPVPPPAPAPGDHGQGTYKLGQPYQIDGVWYYPTADFTYDETGIASWYGPDFDQKVTADGEIFDQNVASAAHKTLALPTIVQVTNLDNGRSIQLRVNDRGPFVGNRILDVSRRAAQLLGFEETGTAKVRVRVAVTETMQARSIAKHDSEEAGEAPPPAVPHGAVAAETLPPPGSNTPPQPVPAAPEVPPVQLAALPPNSGTSESVYLVPVSPNHIFIQAGAYASAANALRMQSLLGGLGQVMVTIVRANGVALYRVRLGPIASVEEADRLLSRVVGAGAGDAKIVVD